MAEQGRSVRFPGARASRPLKENAGRSPAFPGDALTLRDDGTDATAYAEADALGTRDAGSLEHNGGGTPALPGDDLALRDGVTGAGATSYAEAVGVYLAFAVDKCVDYWSVICTWHNSREIVRNTFGRQAIPMMWDYTEGNIFSTSSGNWTAMLDWVWKSLQLTPARTPSGKVVQADASVQIASFDKIVSTDPPYYDT